MAITTFHRMMLMMPWIIIPALDARSVVTSAQWKDLTARVRALETAIEIDAEKHTDEEDAGLRVVVDKIEQFIAELTSLRKDVFGRIKQVSKDIKAHATDIVAIKKTYKALAQALGNPASMKTVARDVKTAFEVIAMIDNDMVLVKKMLGITPQASSSSAAPVSSAAVPVSSDDVSAPASNGAVDSAAATSSVPVASA